jgi:hypothetical protein
LGRREKNWYHPRINLSLNGLCDNTPCFHRFAENNSSLLSWVFGCCYLWFWILGGPWATGSVGPIPLPPHRFPALRN